MIFVLSKDNIPYYSLDNNAFFSIGKYGETLHFTKIRNGYLLTSSALGIWDQKVDEVQKNALIDTYCVKGVPDFAVSDRIRILDRACVLGKNLYDYYIRFQSTNDETILPTMKEILENSKALKLNSEDYLDCFLTFGEKEDKTYLSFIRQLAGE